jgi:hypothetical protein
MLFSTNADVIGSLLNTEPTCSIVLLNHERSFYPLADSSLRIIGHAINIPHQALRKGGSFFSLLGSSLPFFSAYRKNLVLCKRIHTGHNIVVR